MATIFGTVGLGDSDRVFARTEGQSVIYDIARQYVAERNADLMQQMGLFLQEQTESYKERFKLPGGGHLEERGGGTAPVASAKTTGYWDVAYPLFDFGRAVSFDFVTRGYMTAAEMQQHIDGVIAANVNTVRHQMLRRLFNSNAQTVTDERVGSLTVQALANGDSTLYPPVQGATAEATDNHYIETNYTSANISDTNNPLVTIERELVEHFGGSGTGYSNVMVLINTAEQAKIEALANFVEVPDNYVRPGQDTAVPFGLPTIPNSARLIGRSNGCWVAVWDWIPATYMLGIHLEAPKPLKMRVDLMDTGLGSGLQLRAEDERFPLTTASWVNRFGFGVGNRLNGVMVEVAAGGSYTVPSGYAF